VAGLNFFPVRAEEEIVSKKAVILAGGKGSRLAPYTTVLPKPLLPVGDQAILDIVVRQLRSHEFSDLTFAVGYLAHLIRAVFNDGSHHGVSIAYTRRNSLSARPAPWPRSRASTTRSCR